MAKRMVTIETRLQNNSELVKYLNTAVTTYEWVKRKIWHEMTNIDYVKNYANDAVFGKHCRAIYGLHSRATNSVINEVRGIMNAYMELKKTELKQVEGKIEIQEERIAKTLEVLNELKPFVTKNIATEKELKRYRKKKFLLYHQKNRLNRLKIKLENLNHIIDKKIYKVCFGSKYMFNKQFNLESNHYKTHIKWHNDFIKSRDKNIWLTGSVNEPNGNGMVSLIYNPELDTFVLKMRKVELGDYSKYDQAKYVTCNSIKINYRRQDILTLLNEQQLNTKHKKAIHYRFHRKGTAWYLQIVYVIEYNIVNSVTRNSYGVIGLDYNDKFIQLAETNATGNLVKLQRFNLIYHGTGKRALHEIEQVINSIVKYAISVGKDIAIEDLDFKKTKSMTVKAKSKKGKQYNKMLHLFDYHRYKQKLKDITFNNKVVLLLINPKNTTKIAKQKFCNQRKLTSHQGASYVIARKAQGFKDDLKPIKQKKAA